MRDKLSTYTYISLVPHGEYSEDNARARDRFGVGQWPCALDGYVSRIHDANSSLIGHRHDPRPSCARALSTRRGGGRLEQSVCTHVRIYVYIHVHRCPVHSPREIYTARAIRVVTHLPHLNVPTARSVFSRNAKLERDNNVTRVAAILILISI